MVPPRRKKSKFSSFGFASKKTSPGHRRLSSSISRRAEDKMFTQDLTRANQIQFTLLPEKIPTIPGYDFKVHYQSCKEIGGDYYDFIDIDEDHLGIIIADVSGKGISGAMIMTMARAVIRLIARNNPDAKDTIIRANRFMARDIKNVMFLTVLYMVLNKRTRTIEVVNAGHNPLIYYDGREHRLINPSGIAVGFDLGKVFEPNLKSAELMLNPGDRIIVYTDGVVESTNKWGEEFGEEWFLEIVDQYSSRSSGEFLNYLVNALKEHQGNAPQHDDVTIVTLRYTG